MCFRTRPTHFVEEVVEKLVTIATFIPSSLKRLAKELKRRRRLYYVLFVALTIFRPTFHSQQTPFINLISRKKNFSVHRSPSTYYVSDIFAIDVLLFRSLVLHTKICSTFSTEENQLTDLWIEVCEFWNGKKASWISHLPFHIAGSCKFVLRVLSRQGSKIGPKTKMTSPRENEIWRNSREYSISVRPVSTTYDAKSPFMLNARLWK